MKMVELYYLLKKSQHLCNLQWMRQIEEKTSRRVQQRHNITQNLQKRLDENLKLERVWWCCMEKQKTWKNASKWEKKNFNWVKC